MWLACVLGVLTVVYGCLEKKLEGRETEPMSVEERGEPIGQIAIAAYRPRKGQEEALLKEVKNHLPILRSQGLVTDRRSIVMRAQDGTILEVFEWKSAKAIEEAHSNEVVAAMWKRFEDACEYVKLSDLTESGEAFATFEPVNW